ncbi:unnamed protein product, partial [Laminaria digitata]
SSSLRPLFFFFAVLDMWLNIMPHDHATRSLTRDPLSLSPTPLCLHRPRSVAPLRAVFVAKSSLYARRVCFCMRLYVLLYARRLRAFTCACTCFCMRGVYVLLYARVRAFRFGLWWFRVPLGGGGNGWGALGFLLLLWWIPSRHAMHTTPLLFPLFLSGGLLFFPFLSD